MGTHPIFESDFDCLTVLCEECKETNTKMERLKLGIEVGQIARLKKIVTEDNLTHDWEVSVRGADKNNVSAYVDKVVFELHESFENPLRVVSQPDSRGVYTCKASGYAGFLMPIRISFKDGNEVRLVHDLLISHERPKVEKSQVQDFLLIVKSKEYREIALSCGAKIKSQSPRKSPPLLSAPSSSSSSRDQQRREKDEKRSHKKKSHDLEKETRKEKRDKSDKKDRKKEIDDLFDPDQGSQTN